MSGLKRTVIEVLVLGVLLILGDAYMHAVKTGMGNDFAQALKVMNDSVHHVTDLYKSEHGINEELQLSLTEAKALNGKLLDSITKRDKIAAKQLESHTDVAINATGGGIIVHDTIRVATGTEMPRETFNNGVLDFIESGDSAHYDINIALEYDRYWKRKWLLGRKEYFADAYTKQPGVHITNLESFSVHKDPLPVEITLTGGATLRGQPFLGVGISYVLKRFWTQ